MQRSLSINDVNVEEIRNGGNSKTYPGVATATTRLKH